MKKQSEAMDRSNDDLLDVPAVLRANALIRMPGQATNQSYFIRITRERQSKYHFEALEDIPLSDNQYLKAGEVSSTSKENITLIRRCNTASE